MKHKFVRCIDCKYYRPTMQGSWKYDYDKCIAKYIIIDDPIIGKRKRYNNDSPMLLNFNNDCKLYKRIWWKVWR